MSRYRRHPAEVTSDRLGDAVERWHDKFSPGERDMIGTIRQRLEEIAEDAGSETANSGEDRPVSETAGTDPELVTVTRAELRAVLGLGEFSLVTRYNSEAVSNAWDRLAALGMELTREETSDGPGRTDR